MTEIEDLRELVNRTVINVQELVKQRDEARQIARILYRSYTDSPTYIGDVFPNVEFPDWVEE